ncbi:MAG: helix-turn-helix transcriptional regulator [Clostridia bacterium]|nr:helix-turn-helix transcriptional regulator [Clostridia bacterium]MBR3429998.1 helix-turn-helix transcriptional regulator [Clostridia bacterium]
MYERRKELGLTLEEVGNAVGVGKSTVRKWENGMIKNMGRDKIVLLAKTLRLSPVAFVPSGTDSISLSMDEHRLITAYRKADPGTQASVRKLLDIPEEKSSETTAV